MDRCCRGVSIFCPKSQVRDAFASLTLSEKKKRRGKTCLSTLVHNIIIPHFVDLRNASQIRSLPILCWCAGYYLFLHSICPVIFFANAPAVFFHLKYLNLCDSPFPFEFICRWFLLVQQATTFKYRIRESFLKGITFLFFFYGTQFRAATVPIITPMKFVSFLWIPTIKYYT